MSILGNRPHQTKPNSTTPNQTHPYQTKLNCTKPNSCIPNRTHPNQTKLIHTKPNSSTPNQTHPYQTELIHTKQNLTAPNQTHPYQTKLNQTTKPNSNKANQKPFILPVCPNCLSKPNQTNPNLPNNKSRLLELRNSFTDLYLFLIIKRAFYKNSVWVYRWWDNWQVSLWESRGQNKLNSVNNRYYY